MSEDTPPMPDDVSELVAGARRLESPPAEVRARLHARITAALPRLPDGGDDSGPSEPGTKREREHGADEAAGDSRTPATRAPNVRAEAPLANSGTPLRLAASWARAPWWVVGAALVVGVGAGRWSSGITHSPSGLSALQTSAPPVTAPTPVQAQTPESVAAITKAPDTTPEASFAPITPIASARAPSTEATSVRPPAPAVSAGTLAAERQALDVAKAAFGRGEAAFALKACEDHARRFPNGVLAEEREAIAIQALVETSERTLARARAERFQQRYPKSILWPVVSGALEKAP